MRNKFSATCRCCRQPVAAGAGETNKVGDQWVTVHDTCPPAPQRAHLYPMLPGDTHNEPELDGLCGRDYDDEFYGLYGMTQADFRDAVNPDEGDH